MSRAVAQTQTFENCASGLRYGLIEIEPFKEERIVKKFGIRFREQRWGVKPSESFNDFLKFNTEAIVKNITLPDHLDQNKTIEIIAEKRIKNFENDEELKKALEKIDKSKAESKFEKLVKFFLDRQRNHLEDIFDWYSSLFLASDLPLSFVSDFTDYEVTYMASLEALLEIVRSSRIRMTLFKRQNDYRKYSKEIEVMKFRSSPIIDHIENAVFRAQSLKWYIRLSNSESVEKIFDPKTISQSKMDKNELEILHLDFIEDSKKLRKLVMGLDKDDRIFRPLVDQPEVKSSFGEMVMALTS